MFESHLMFLQIRKIGIVSEGIRAQVPGLLAADVNKHKQIVARVTENDRYFILVLDRLGGRDVSPTIPSACNHASPCIITHPSDPCFVLEGCLDCRVIRNYNIHTGERCVVHKGLRPIRMCHGPSGSILVEDFLSLRMKVLKLTWVKEQELLVDETYKKDELIRKWCYAERFDMLVIMSHEDNGIKAVKLENGNPIWKLSGVVGGQMFDPDAITSNTEGNVYVSDGANNRILKINGFTGDVVSVFLLEKENKMPIRSLFWSDTKPNLTLIHGHKISTYNI